MPDYSTGEAARLSGASPNAVRSYAKRHSRYFSDTGAPSDRGSTRKFTRDDVRLIAYIRHLTQNEGQSHEQVAESLAQGALSAWDWQPPDVPAGDVQPPEATEALATVHQLQIALAAMRDVRERQDAELVDARDEAERLREEIRKLERELGKAEGALAALQAQPQRRGWWARLWGIKT